MNKRSLLSILGVATFATGMAASAGADAQSLEETQAYQAAVQAGSTSALLMFLQQYPYGVYAKPAFARVLSMDSALSTEVGTFSTSSIY